MCVPSVWEKSIGDRANPVFASEGVGSLTNYLDSWQLSQLR